MNNIFLLLTIIGFLGIPFFMAWAVICMIRKRELSFDRINQGVPLDFMLKTDKMKLPLHEFSFVKATAFLIPYLYISTCSLLTYVLLRVIVLLDKERRY